MTVIPIIKIETTGLKWLLRRTRNQKLDHANPQVNQNQRESKQMKIEIENKKTHVHA